MTDDRQEPKWLTPELVIAFHDHQLREHGGPSGIRDRGALESALDRPRNRWAYQGSDLPTLAAAYAFGIARNHPFVDGNKPTALLALVTFLGINDVGFVVGEAEAVVMIVGLAAGEVSEENLARWIADNFLPAGSARGRGAP